MAVLSSPVMRSGWHRTSVPVWVALHVLLLLVLFGGMRHPPVPPDPPAFEMIAAVAAPQPEPQPAQEPPVASVAAADDPASPPLDLTPGLPQEAGQAPVPEPQVQTSVLAEPEAAVPPVLPAAPKPVHVLTTHSFVARPVLQQTVAPAAPPQAAQTAPSAAPSGTAEAGRHAEESLRGLIRNAVQAAVRCPAAARMMELSGKAGVAFDYRDGALVGGVQLTRSTGTPMLDSAALAAVRDAHYPDPPLEAANHLLRFVVWVEEACSN